MTHQSFLSAEQQRHTGCRQWSPRLHEWLTGPAHCSPAGCPPTYHKHPRWAVLPQGSWCRPRFSGYPRSRSLNCCRLRRSAHPRSCLPQCPHCQWNRCRHFSETLPGARLLLCPPHWGGTHRCPACCQSCLDPSPLCPHGIRSLLSLRSWRPASLGQWRCPAPCAPPQTVHKDSAVILWHKRKACPPLLSGAIPE